MRIWFGEGSEGKRENGEDGEDMGVDHLCLSERSVKGGCGCVCKQNECYMDMRVIVLVMKNGERAGWVFFIYFCFRDEKWMRDFEGDEGDEGGIAAAVPVLLVVGAVE